MKFSSLLKNALVGSAYVGVLAFAPISFDVDSGVFTYHAAFAKDGNGGGNGNGNGGGNGNGNSGGNGGGNANGHANSSNSSSSTNDKASLGRLNAAHASENALLHASPNSVVGKLAQYKAAVLESNALIEEANALDPEDPDYQAKLDDINDELDHLSQVEADALASAANKEVTDEVETATDDLLGIEHLARPEPTTVQ